MQGKGQEELKVQAEDDAHKCVEYGGLERKMVENTRVPFDLGL